MKEYLRNPKTDRMAKHYLEKTAFFKRMNRKEDESIAEEYILQMINEMEEEIRRLKIYEPKTSPITGRRDIRIF